MIGGNWFPRKIASKCRESHQICLHPVMQSSCFFQQNRHKALNEDKGRRHPQRRIAPGISRIVPEFVPEFQPWLTRRYSFNMFNWVLSLIGRCHFKGNFLFTAVSWTLKPSFPSPDMVDGSSTSPIHVERFCTSSYVSTAWTMMSRRCH